MPPLTGALSHLMTNVLGAAHEYYAAEGALSAAEGLGSWEFEAVTARRKAAELAVAIDGLSDRMSSESTIAIEDVRSSVAALCFWPGGTTRRQGAFERIHGVANAYKHMYLNRKSHVIHSFDDVLVVGAGFGVDGFGVGKFAGVEVLVRDKGGETRKFLGDVPVVVAAWIRYLRSLGGALTNDPIEVCGLNVNL